MNTERIINMHTHIFPSKIAEKAVGAIGDFYDIKMQIKGTPEFILEDGKNINVEKYLVSSTATTAHQVQSINNFIAESKDEHSEFIGFGSLHPESETLEEDAEHLIELGLKGVKLHPDIQNFKVDDPKVIKIFEICNKRKLPQTPTELKKY